MNGYRTIISEDKQRLLDSDSAYSQSSQDNSPFTTRKRTSAKVRGDAWSESFRDETNIDVPLPELDFNDPNFLELLREYEKDEGDRSSSKELDALRAQAHRKQGLGQGATYLLLIAFIALFVVVINYYNGKQLERLKEEYGLGEEKKILPEFWWKRAVIYNIYVPAYQDSNGDGIGDLNGVLSHLDHLTYLGVDAVLLSSVLESPLDDFGQDVTDFKSVARHCGTAKDFEILVRELHARGIKVVLELVPNHTHRLHRWFSKSRLGSTAHSGRYKDYYVWHPGKTLANGTRVPPNNWLSVVGGSAWTWDEMRGEYYYHYNHAILPDLNHRNIHVREEFMEMFSHWLDNGVDALYIEGLHSLYEVTDLELDEPRNYRTKASPVSFSVVSITPLERRAHSVEHDYLDHVYTEDQADVHDYYAIWREFIENYSTRAQRRVAILADIHDDTVTDVIKYYFTGIDLPVCPALTGHRAAEGRGLQASVAGGRGLHSTVPGGKGLHEVIDMWLMHLPQNHDALWMLGNGERGRITLRHDPVYQNTLNMLALLLPGAVYSYYGDELGMSPVPSTTKSGAMTESEIRKASRGRMIWSSNEINKDQSSSDRPTDVQMTDPTGHSTLQIYHRLTRLRKERSFVSGKLQFSLVTNHVLSFMRYAKDGAPYLIALNLGNTTSMDDYTLSSGVTYGKVVLAALLDGAPPAASNLGKEASQKPGSKKDGIQHQGGSVNMDEVLGNFEAFRGSENPDFRREGRVEGEGRVDLIREGEKVNLARLTLAPGEGVVVILMVDDTMSLNNADM